MKTLMKFEFKFMITNLFNMARPTKLLRIQIHFHSYLEKNSSKTAFNCIHEDYR